MSVPEILLGLLEHGPRHGYELSREYDARFGWQRPVKAAQVHATLSRLRRDGDVEIVSVERVGGPDRTTYALTPDGVTHLERWLDTPEAVTPFLQSVVFVKVMLALLSGRDARRILGDQRAAHRQVMREVTARKTGADLATKVAWDFTLFHLEADLRWLDHTTARLDHLAGEAAR
ncbi:PadR family transcriptional regulator [Phytohabitans houttuyneae]|jgi:DNA-binding PadR family transcriptional regulator|uniref:PadR family transcriptional regulator n=1 Tax=Phytohabitans houttuyneae TaxID=1076126 RepID=A0A6V8KTA8_9ACTN|nr:PadR family transcriptional regulator [Phytohabitans houttuyneae]GFJ83825.1 PadR family transcriptional regulator [Phytohabitans houttuyneae]